MKKSLTLIICAVALIHVLSHPLLACSSCGSDDKDDSSENHAIL
jgi:hypothetical protein